MKRALFPITLVILLSVLIYSCSSDDWTSSYQSGLISPANPQKESGFILKGCGVGLRVLGFNPQIKVGN